MRRRRTTAWQRVHHADEQELEAFVDGLIERMMWLYPELTKLEVMNKLVDRMEGRE